MILDVTLHPRLKNNFEIGFGYTTEFGMRSKIVWNKPWINTYGHSLDSYCSLSPLEQFFNINYKIPLLRSPLEEYFLLKGGIIYENNICNNKFNFITLSIVRCWICPHDWKRSINLNWHFNYYMPNSLKKSVVLIYPGISVCRIRQRGNFVPDWGDNQRYSINISNSIWNSNVDFIIFQAQNTWIRSFLKKNRILAHGNLTWIYSNSLEVINPFFRFLINDDFGIRGYGHSSRFMKNNINNDLDITKLCIGTLEYQYNIMKKWWGVIFIDVGEITDHIRWNNLKCGLGIGIRWQFPIIGPIKLDMAIPLIKDEKINHNFLYFYINLGPEL